MNPILARLENEIKAEKQNQLEVSYNVRLSRNHINTLETIAKQLNIKQSELIRMCIQNLPDLLK